MRSLLVACALGACASPIAATTPDARGEDASTVASESLEIHALGVQGFALSYGGDVVMTAPMFTRQSAVEIALDRPLVPDTAAIDAGLAGLPLEKLRAIVSGHAHYDHLLDVPHVLARAPHATAYTNRSGRHTLAALAPDRPGCASPPAAAPIARDRVVAVDDPLISRVDYTHCPAQRPPGAPLAGTWLHVPGSRVRVMALCSEHPPQIGPFHFGEGTVDGDLCELPRAAAGWLEGQTVAFLIDFLDRAGAPAFRVFYQDAPTDAPVGHAAAAVLGERAVDVALLCAGNADAVDDHPGAIVANLAPRFALSGHWEDFFTEASPPRPLPLLDLAGYVTRADAALPGPASPPLVVDGAPFPGRHVLVRPNSRFVVPPR